MVPLTEISQAGRDYKAQIHEIANATPYSTSIAQFSSVYSRPDACIFLGDTTSTLGTTNKCYVRATQRNV